jgi:hypothetical protein
MKGILVSYYYSYNVDHIHTHSQGTTHIILSSVSPLNRPAGSVVIWVLFRCLCIHTAMVRSDSDRDRDQDVHSGPQVTVVSYRGKDEVYVLETCALSTCMPGSLLNEHEYQFILSIE